MENEVYKEKKSAYYIYNTRSLLNSKYQVIYVFNLFREIQIQSKYNFTFFVVLNFNHS